MMVMAMMVMTILVMKMIVMAMMVMTMMVMGFVIYNFSSNVTILHQVERKRHSDDNNCDNTHLHHAKAV